MNVNKKSRSSVGAPEREAEMGTTCNVTTYSTTDFNIKDFRRQGIARYLGYGRKNAITAARLAELLELPDIRQVSKAIERERRMRVPICASNDSIPGYFLPETPGELRLYLESLNRRSRNLRIIILALTEALDEMEAQETIWQ